MWRRSHWNDRNWAQDARKNLLWVSSESPTSSTPLGLQRSIQVWQCCRGIICGRKSKTNADYSLWRQVLQNRRGWTGEPFCYLLLRVGVSRIWSEPHDIRANWPLSKWARNLWFGILGEKEIRWRSHLWLSRLESVGSLTWSWPLSWTWPQSSWSRWTRSLSWSLWRLCSHIWRALSKSEIGCQGLEKNWILWSRRKQAYSWGFPI